MKIGFLCISLLVGIVSKSQNTAGFQILDKPGEKRVEILWNGKLLTAYCYYDSISKPILFPVKTIDGITITRGFPIQPLPGERTDHTHHTGMWMNFESVNGIDFWNNSTAIPLSKKNLYGTIVHQQIISKKAKANNASLSVTAKWINSEGKILVHEKTTYVFHIEGNLFFIDRNTTLEADKEKVIFKDSKDGFFAIRVARELEMPSKEATKFTDIHGNITTVPMVNTEGVTGMYYSSNGLKGDSVWSSIGTWTMLQGKKDGKFISISILDHPSNIGYPSYWHARGYGLFAINPLGRNIFSNGKDKLNFTLEPGRSATFHYRVIITTTKLSYKEVNDLALDFEKE